MTSNIIGIIDTGSRYCQTVFLSGKEVVERRNKLRADAFKFLKENDVDHIIYYSDERDADGNIVKAWFYYDMVGMDDKTFFDRTKNYNGFIGAVHKR